MQKELGQIQGELTHIQTEFSQLDAKIDVWLKDLQEGIKSEVHTELHSELHSLFEQYFGQGPPMAVNGTVNSKGKGILGTQPGFSSQKHLVVSPMAERGHSSMSSRGVLVEADRSTFRMECPSFDGENFRGWWSKIEQYFEAEGIGDHAKVRLVMLHLEGKALDWHHFFSRRHGDYINCFGKIYARGLKERFGSDSFLDPMVELVILKQIGSVDQYHDGFLSLLNQLNLSESYALSIFLSNLKAEIGQYLRLFKPQTLVEGYNLARQVENIVHGPIKKENLLTSGSSVGRPLLPVTRSFRGSNSLNSTSESTNGKSNFRVPSKSLSQAELEDRRKKGLYFWCGLKYSPGHKCSKSQMYQLVVEPWEDSCPDIRSPTQEDFQDCPEQLETTELGSGNSSPVLSLHALHGLQGHNTMQFPANIDRCEVVVLVDSGSTHNFIDFKVARRLKLVIEPVPCLKVSVANGVKLNTHGLCKAVEWETQGYKCVIDFLVLSVKGFDVVLGIQWLLSLGPIVWDFANLTMQFKCGLRNYSLKGTIPGSMQVIPSGQFSRCMSLVGNGPGPMLLTSYDQTVLTMPPAQASLDLEKLLNDFEDIFQVPTQLPPLRLHDHRIPLVDESKVVKVHPYRYPTVQKAEIKKLI
ncbi:uncharacterized protein LOC105782546 [Gossypium raimondii]|uniref:uncharacterized protein LOC105782546 n=1 Tax=Gossypium raimondii TaxID=29730 RepID=UPI00227C9FBE|nr:uncharacterized protein LOC105782546 [Gossypium raimondii]